MNKTISGEKSKIMVVEDNVDLLFNMEMTLEFNGYHVITAKNGSEALDILYTSTDNPPDLIISDIMMPKLDGYEFFKKVSENPKLGLIPFLFLSAKGSPEEVRFGKMLGVDDYLTKPVDFNLLLATIAGKLARKGKADVIRRKIESEIYSSLNIQTEPSLQDRESRSISLIVMSWNESIGPELKVSYPKDDQTFSTFHEAIGSQLFHAAAALYGQTGLFKAQGILLNVENYNRGAYVFFDSLKNLSVRGEYLLFMIAVIAPKINYFESLRIQEVIQSMSVEIKRRENLDDWENLLLMENWKEISKILSTSLFEDGG